MNRDDTMLVIVDVQGKLARIVHESEQVLKNIAVLARGMRRLGGEVVWLEQNPQGLGPTVPEVAAELDGLTPIPKMTFDACDTEAFVQAVERTGRKNVLLTGIETHICVYQTAIGLRDRGFAVQAVADAVSSRTAANKEIGLRRMEAEGIRLTSVEMALFELLKTASDAMFKPILQWIK